MYPLSVFLIVFGSEFIEIIFGNKWGKSIIPMQILATTGFISPLFYFNTTAMIALRETRKVLMINALEFIIGAVCAALMAEKGLIWAAASYVVRSLLFVPISLWMMWKHTELPMTASLKASWKPAVATLVLAGVAITMRNALAHVLPQIPAALVAGVLGAASYAIVIWSIAPDEITDLILRSPFKGIIQKLGLRERTPRRA
jgi:O-antigen/teichoic acid export membrane protein